MRPFFQGLTPTLLGIVPYSGTTWLCYETLKDYTDLFPCGGSSSTTNKCVSGVSSPLSASFPNVRNDMLIEIGACRCCGMVAGLVGQSVPLGCHSTKMQVSWPAFGAVCDREPKKTFAEFSRPPPQVNREGTMLVVIKRPFRLGGTRTLFKGLSLSWFKGPLATMSLNTFELLKELYSRWSAS
jgi:hypothetical protein